jgi:cob(I)alamin adenosyltransferase
VPGNRERRAAKQRRRDAKRGHVPGDRSADRPTDPGLPPESLQAVLRSTAADLAAGDEGALTELRHVLVEHLARRRDRVLAACDVVTAEVSPGVATAGLGAALAAGETVSSWAEREGVRTEEAAVATVRLLASSINA